MDEKLKLTPYETQVLSFYYAVSQGWPPWANDAEGQRKFLSQVTGLSEELCLSVCKSLNNMGYIDGFTEDHKADEGATGSGG